MNAADFRELLASSFDKAVWAKKSKADSSVSLRQAWHNYHDAVAKLMNESPVDQAVISNFRKDFYNGHS